MKHILFYTILCINILSMSSCKYIERQKLYYTIKYWQKQKLIIPDNIETKIQGEKVIAFSPNASTYSILHYIDTLECVSCELKLHEWQLFKKEIDSLNINAHIIFVAWSNQFTELEKLQLINKCDIPCMYDYENKVASINHFTRQSDFHTFLLDSLNHVLVVGNPIKNKLIRKLYIQQMQCTSSNE